MSENSKKLIYFFNASAISGDVVSLPYAYASLRTYAETHYKEIKNNYDWQMPILLIDSIESTADKIINPSILACSCYLWSTQRSLDLAREIKTRNPHTLTVLGGPDVPKGKVDFFHKYPWIDILVHEEGEQIFSEILLEKLKDSPDWGSIKGITYRGENNVANFNGTKEKLDLSKLITRPHSLPHMKQALDELKAAGYIVQAITETNRGCPYGCTFCDWGQSTMSKIREIPIERIKEEISLICEMKIDLVYNSDANFGILPRDLEIAEYWRDQVQKHGTPYNFHGNFAKRVSQRVVDICKIFCNDLNFTTNATISLQSTSQVVLDNIKRSNIKLEYFHEFKSMLESVNSGSYSELILGLPGETFESYSKGVCSLMKPGHPANIYSYNLMTLENAPMNQPSYIEKFGLKFEALPQRNVDYTYQGEKKTEYMKVVKSTLSMPEDDLKKSYMFFAFAKIAHRLFWQDLKQENFDQANTTIFEIYFKLFHNHVLEGFDLSKMNTLYKTIATGFSDVFYKMKTNIEPIVSELNQTLWPAPDQHDYWISAEQAFTKLNNLTPVEIQWPKYYQLKGSKYDKEVRKNN